MHITLNTISWLHGTGMEWYTLLRLQIVYLSLLQFTWQEFLFLRNTVCH